MTAVSQTLAAETHAARSREDDLSILRDHIRSVLKRASSHPALQERRQRSLVIMGGHVGLLPSSAAPCDQAVLY